MSLHRFPYLLLNLKILRPITECVATQEYIYYLHGKELTSARLHINYPSAACAASPSSVADTIYSCQITEVLECLLCYAQLHKVFESEEEML